MRIIKDARNPNNNHEVREAGKTVFESKPNKIIDADAEQEYKLALEIAEMNAGRRPSPAIIIAREVKA